MYAHCPICNTAMDGKMHCKNCHLAIDRAHRKAFFTAQASMRLQEEFMQFNKTEWDGVSDKSLNIPMLGDDGRFMINNVVVDMFERRLCQVIQLGAGINAVNTDSKKTHEAYLFERWCLLNATEPDEQTKFFFQLLCSPTLEERMNRLWKIFPVKPVDRHGMDAVYGFVANPTSRFVLADKGGAQNVKAFKLNTAPYCLQTIAKRDVIPMKDPEFFHDFYSTFAAVILNDYSSALIADVCDYIVPPTKMSKADMVDFQYAKEVLVPINRSVITKEYRDFYGVEAKRDVLLSWGIAAADPGDVVITFWKELSDRVSRGLLEER